MSSSVFLTHSSSAGTDGQSVHTNAAQYSQTQRMTDRQSGQTDRLTKRQTNRQIDRKTERQTTRQTAGTVLAHVRAVNVRPDPATTHQIMPSRTRDREGSMRAAATCESAQRTCETETQTITVSHKQAYTQRIFSGCLLSHSRTYLAPNPTSVSSRAQKTRPR